MRDLVARLRRRGEQRSTVRRGRRVARALAGPRLIAEFAARYPEARFVEIGANDGDQHDHLGPVIRAHPWRGIMVEPVPYVFERLRQNYGDLERVALENVAVANRNGELPFYHLRQADPGERARLPGWYDGVGSFSKQTVMTHRDEIPDIAQRLLCTPVRSLTFASLCAEHGLETVDLIVIDTEGYDHHIIDSIDFDRHRPRMVIYEHYHLNPAERERVRSRLCSAGYETMEEGFDTFCLRTEVADSLTAAWRALSPAVAGVSIHDQQR